ncbi:hypothetical protein [Altericista sp. CCNU0014]|uniref:hypothetical protein n=1 Tax=Altericista sp. CCNU0014 TaxID=3082949 RepID=UPI00384D7A64
MISIFRFAMPVICVATLFAPLEAQASQQVPSTVNQRQANQQRRIFNGVQDDSIGPKEYRNLQRRSLSIELQQKRDRRDGGSFTAQERYHLNRRLNRVSNSIYRDRHD